MHEWGHKAMTPCTWSKYCLLQANLLVLATVYIRADQAYRAYHLLKGTQHTAFQKTIFIWALAAQELLGWECYFAPARSVGRLLHAADSKVLIVGRKPHALPSNLA